jgi:hypothetical protein
MRLLLLCFQAVPLCDVLIAVVSGVQFVCFELLHHRELSLQTLGSWGTDILYFITLDEVCFIFIIIIIIIIISDRLCGLVVRVPGYRSWGPGSIRGTTRFS